MAYRDYTDTKWRIFRESLLELFAKVRSFASIIACWAVASLALAAIIGLVNSWATPGVETGPIDIIKTGLFSLYDFLPGAQDNVTDDTITYVARSAGFVVTAVFSAICAIKLTQPINPIDFARYIVIDTDRDELVIRYRTRYPERRYLYDATIDFTIVEHSSSISGYMETDKLFSYSEPRDNDRYLGDHYGRIRGVRYVAIPTDTTSATVPNNSLKDAIAKAIEDKEVEIVVRARGMRAEGQLMDRAVSYDKKNLLYGYRFVSIRRDEIREYAGKPKDDKSPEPRKGKELFYEHFNMVNKLKPKLTSEEYLGVEHDAKPWDIHVLGVGEVAPRFSSLREWRFRLRDKLRLGDSRKGSTYRLGD